MIMMNLNNKTKKIMTKSNRSKKNKKTRQIQMKIQMIFKNMDGKPNKIDNNSNLKTSVKWINTINK